MHEIRHSTQSLPAKLKPHKQNPLSRTCTINSLPLFLLRHQYTPPKFALVVLFYQQESITSVVLELGANGHFGARTCGIHWTGATTWFRCANTVLTALGYEINADLAASVAWGPLSKTRSAWPVFFFLQKNLDIFYFSQKRPCPRGRWYFILFVVSQVSPDVKIKRENVRLLHSNTRPRFFLRIQHATCC